MTDPAIPVAAGYPAPDRDAVLAAFQDQLDDMQAALQAQQAAIDALAAQLWELGPRVDQLERQTPGDP
jgi:hypothetical protein